MGSVYDNMHVNVCVSINICECESVCECVGMSVYKYVYVTVMMCVYL